MFKLGSVEFEQARVLPEGYPAQTINSERVFEIPLLKYYVNKFERNMYLIEVGAVSKHFMKTQHMIYDAQEQGVINEFAEDLKYEGKHVLCISTLEHIGKGDYNLTYHPMRCISVLNMMLEAKTFLITFPIGYNTLLDYYVRNVIVNVVPAYVRTASRDALNNWVMDVVCDFDQQYGNPYPFGNGVCVITNLPEFI